MNNLLEKHMLGDDVMVDWGLGQDPEPAVVTGLTDGSVWLLFSGETRDRRFLRASRGLYRSEKGQFVEISRAG